jgi:predicted phosphodiesterase
MYRILVVSDIHHAGREEQLRRGFEERVAPGRLSRALLRGYRRHFWLDDPMAHNHRLPEILQREPTADLVIGNGDFTLDSAFVGVSDEAACASAQECLQVLGANRDGQFLAVMGDHELGKKSFLGDQGGIRQRSLELCLTRLGLHTAWHRMVGRWHLIGVTSSLVAWEMFESESVPGERKWWRAQHTSHLQEIEGLVEEIPAGDPWILFCHDPSALPVLRSLRAVSFRMPSLQATIIGHLHTPMILRLGQALAGFPHINWAGNSLRRYTYALQQARCWRKFHLHLCPSPPGVQFLKDGGFLTIDIDPSRKGGFHVRRHRLPW